MRYQYLIIIYFLISTLSANEDLDISHFYESALDGPCITFDPTYTTAFYLNNYNPNILSDYQILDIRINGSNLTPGLSSLNPLGSYIISPLYNIFIKDTISSTAFEHNRGDYAYNENVIFINNKYENNLSSFFMAQSKKYDGLQSINSNSDPLQNYFLNISKKYFSADQSLYRSISGSLMYHKENAVIPLINDSYNRNSEGFLSGFSVSSYSDFFDFKLSNSFQLNRDNYGLGWISDMYTSWFDIEAKLKINNFINIISLYQRKEKSYDYKFPEDFNNPTELDTNQKVVLDKQFLTSQFKYNKLTFNLTLCMLNQNNNNDYKSQLTSPRLNFNLIYNLKNTIISLNRTTHSYLNGSDIANYQDWLVLVDNTLFDLTTLKINYNNKFLNLILEPFQLTSYFYMIEEFPISDEGGSTSILNKAGKANGVNTLLSFKNNYIITELKSSFYNSDFSYPINFYSNYSILFAPKINKKRFRPFIGLNGIFMDLSENSYIDYSANFSLPYVNSLNSDSNVYKQINLLNVQLGIIVNQFKVSYHFSNPMNSDVLFSFTDSYQTIAPFSKLQVTWQFLD
tara:strand:+ start:9326 stop:11035 length:1710 start_codon:yes stop_codon:yes gene_type:complete